MSCWGEAYQAEGTASAKTPSRGLLGVFEERQEGQYPGEGWSGVGRGERGVGDETGEAAQVGTYEAYRPLWGFGFCFKTQCHWRVLYRAVI